MIEVGYVLCTIYLSYLSKPGGIHEYSAHLLKRAAIIVSKAEPSECPDIYEVIFIFILYGGS